MKTLGIFLYLSYSQVAPVVAYQRKVKMHMWQEVELLFILKR